MKKKKVIVFGAGGFIGTYLIDELLTQKYKVLASDISPIGERYYNDNNIPYISIDITNKNDFDKIEKKYDAVIHLAALQPANVSEKNFTPQNYIKVNVIGTLNILEFCRKNHVGKIIYACSHRNTQGLWKKNKAIKEEEGRALKYYGEYAMFSISESAAQDCIEYYKTQYNLKSTILRLPPVYGYGPHTEIFKNGKPEKTGFLTFLEKAMACEPLEVWGDSNIGRDIIYVKDVVSAFIKALDNDKAQGLFNITSGKYLSLKEQVEITAKIFWANNTNPKIVELKGKQNCMDSFLYDNSKAKEELDWTPQYSFEEMMIDYKKEMENKKFEYLVKKRKTMFRNN
ncbi:MAG: NAD(P)-dependent oxidoreductase [Bacteroidales bacterium]